ARERSPSLARRANIPSVNSFLPLVESSFARCFQEVVRPGPFGFRESGFGGLTVVEPVVAAQAITLLQDRLQVQTHRRLVGTQRNRQSRQALAQRKGIQL